jgi:serine/threonine protein kinase
MMPAKRMTPALGMEALIGQTIGSHYTLQRLLGRGTKALAFLATHRTMHRTVVVQLLNVPWADDPPAVTRFEEQAKALAGLEHPNIAAVHDFGRDPGRVWVAVEYVEGELLSDYVRRMGRLQLEAFVPIAAQILKGLGGAHARQILHRDLKAASVVLVEEQGRANYVKLLDLGIASLLEGPPDRGDDPPLVGEPAYLAPEVIMNKPSDARADVYAVGVLFYQMLSGRLPIEGDSAKDVLHRQVNDKPAPLAQALPPGHNVPEGLIELIHDCLAKNPDNRPNDANEIVERMIDCVPAAMFRLPVASPRQKTGPLNPNALRAEVEAQANARAATLAAAVEASGARPLQSFESSAPATLPDVKQGGGGGWVLVLLALVGLGVGGYFYLESQKTPAVVPPVTQPQPQPQQPQPQQPPTSAVQLAKAQEFETAGKLTEALAVYEAVLVADPNNATAKERASALKTQIAQAGDAKTPPPETKTEPPPETKVEPPPETKTEPPPEAKVETPPETKAEPPTAAPVKLKLTSTPTKAEVWIDGALKGKTPLDVEVPAGSRTIEIKAKGYETYTETLEAAPDGKKEVSAKLKRADRKTFRDQENAASEDLDPEEGVGTNLEMPLPKR